jgi:hypothetical protein
MQAIPEHVLEGPSMAVSINSLSFVFSRLGTRHTGFVLCGFQFSVGPGLKELHCSAALRLYVI